MSQRKGGKGGMQFPSDFIALGSKAGSAGGAGSKRGGGGGGGDGGAGGASGSSGAQSSSGGGGFKKAGGASGTKFSRKYFFENSEQVQSICKISGLACQYCCLLLLA